MSLIASHPVEVMEDVCRVSRSEARRGDADDGHVVRDFHLFLHLGQVVRLALRSAGHIRELHCSVIKPLVEQKEQVDLEVNPSQKQN